MTSFRQIEANRRNALKSTGPSSEEGKQQSRLNAVRHGLTAETVIGALEDAEDYKAFEAAIIADYDAESAVERELVLRLASLLWRLRRATTMETGLFHIQAEQLLEFGQDRQAEAGSRKSLLRAVRTDCLGRLRSRTTRQSAKPESGYIRLRAKFCRSGRRPRELLFGSRQSAKPCARPAEPIRSHPLASSSPDRVCARCIGPKTTSGQRSPFPLRQPTPKVAEFWDHRPVLQSFNPLGSDRCSRVLLARRAAGAVSPPPHRRQLSAPRLAAQLMGEAALTLAGVRH